MDEVYGIFRDGGEDFEAIALVEAEVVFGVVEGDVFLQVSQGMEIVRGNRDVGRNGDGFGHCYGRKAGPSSHFKKRNARSG